MCGISLTPGHVVHFTPEFGLLLMSGYFCLSMRERLGGGGRLGGGCLKISKTTVRMQLVLRNFISHN